MNRHSVRPFVAAVLVAVSGPFFAEERELPEETRLQKSLVRFVEPSYPMLLQFRGVTSGFAMVWLTVDPGGRLLDAYATEFSHRRFADASLEAIRKWKFRPEGPGSTLPRLYSVRFNFSLAGMVVVEVHPADYVEARSAIQPPKAVFKSYPFDDLDRIPEAFTAPMPAYPEALKAERKSGRVEILFHVDKSGNVRVPLVTYSDDPRFAEAAMAAITRWSFDVPRRHGRPASAFSLQSFTFGRRSSSNG